MLPSMVTGLEGWTGGMQNSTRTRVGMKFTGKAAAYSQTIKEYSK